MAAAPPAQSAQSRTTRTSQSPRSRAWHSDEARIASHTGFVPKASGVCLTSASHCGIGVSTLCSVAFAGQVLAMVTAQLVKVGEIINVCTDNRVPYPVGCISPAILGPSMLPSLPDSSVSHHML